MLLKLSKVVRVLTVPPVMALLLLLTLFFTHRTDMGGTWQLVAAFVFLVVLPVLAYPLQPLFPQFRHKGREGQRSLAMVFSVAGYFLGIVFALVTRAPHTALALYLTYLFSGAILLLFNKAFKLRISGHACGVCGPVALLTYYVSPLALIPGLLLVASVFDASVRTKRHTFPQLFGGAVTPILAMCMAFLIASGTM